MGFGGWELIIVLVLVLMIFGAGKLPKVAEQLGAGIRNFKKSLQEEGGENPKKLENGADEEGG
ncbi:MAG: twin-arginine translocase TatA/TatE family subunit [Bradymonadaceae bacterium]